MKSPTKRSLSASGCRACSPAPGSFAYFGKVDDGDGLDGSVQAFERLGESNSMDDLGIAQPDTTEDDKRGAGYPSRPSTIRKEGCIGTTV